MANRFPPSLVRATNPVPGLQGGGGGLRGGGGGGGGGTGGCREDARRKDQISENIAAL